MYARFAVQGTTREIARDLEQNVREALGRLGTTGEVHVRGTLILLTGPGGTASASAELVQRDWLRLSREERRLAARALARELVERRRAPGGVPPRRRPVALPFVVILTAAGLVLGGFFAYPLVFAPAPPLAAPSSRDLEAERAARAHRVCSETRARVARGATVGPMDAEGWVVELMLVRTVTPVPLLHDHGLRAFLARPEPDLPTRLVWAGTPTLAGIDATGSEVVLSGANLPDSIEPRWHSTTLTFSGRYVEYYFRSTERGSYFALASALGERLGATYAGLFARCVGSRAHAIGSWFRGPSPAGAAAALVYFMGTFGEVVHVASEHLGVDGGAPDPTRVLLDLPELGPNLDRAALATLLARSGGMVAGQPKGPITISFPFERSNRATQASVHLARHFDIAAPL
ncbi:MAG: hypothetical protein JW751_03750 [Polyangiaceae bacterium]|nr:hypothetical protein [Polyangiaceae bacterium]